VPDQVPRIAPFCVTVPVGSIVTVWPWTVHEQTPPALDKVVAYVVVEPTAVHEYGPLHGERGRAPPLLDVVPVVPLVVPVVVPLVVPVVVPVVPVVVLVPLHADEQIPFTQLLNVVATLAQFAVSRDAQFPMQVESLH
jgi:hypothetical protein